jgi:hypothetical protein
MLSARRPETLGVLADEGRCAAVAMLDDAERDAGDPFDELLGADA